MVRGALAVLIAVALVGGGYTAGAGRPKPADPREWSAPAKEAEARVYREVAQEVVPLRPILQAKDMSAPLTREQARTLTIAHLHQIREEAKEDVDEAGGSIRDALAHLEAGEHSAGLESLRDAERSVSEAEEALR